MGANYEIPNWAGKPPAGLHLDVLKDEKLVQKLMVDEKKCYLFGRNNQMTDFCIDHASCSRVHAAFVYHKHLNIAYLVDLGSTHGTYIGPLRLESHKPTKLDINSVFHFGASTRRYVLRERPSTGQYCDIMEELPLGESCDGTLLGLPECQTELDNLTEYNTAHNRRISMLGISDDNRRKSTNLRHRRKQNSVTFHDEEIIINPEDVDPKVGRFRNLLQTSVIPTKRTRSDLKDLSVVNSNVSYIQNSCASELQNPRGNSSLSINPRLTSSSHDIASPLEANLCHQTGLVVTPTNRVCSAIVPNPAPDVAPVIEDIRPLHNHMSEKSTSCKPYAKLLSGAIKGPGSFQGPQKKKYAKEAWPGRKPMLGQL